MITHFIDLLPSLTPGGNSVGGSAILPSDIPYPTCDCGQRMVLFLQFGIQPEFGLPFRSGSQFALFMCPLHNDVPEMFPDGQLPATYWEQRVMMGGGLKFFDLFLPRPENQIKIHPPDPWLQPQTLNYLQKFEQPDRDGFELVMHPKYPAFSFSVGEAVGGWQGMKIGGQPSWAQAPQVHRCSCGAEMVFLCQIPENFPFPKLPTAPKQRDSFSSEDYCLFLGNEVYVFACEAQCHPRALHVVVQN